MVTNTLTVQDIYSYASGKKVDWDATLPFIILPISLLLATISFPITIIIMVMIGMGALYVYSRPRHKNRSPFFYSWTISSCFTMFMIFELIETFLKITLLENIVFLLLFASTGYFFYKMKAVADFELATGTSKGKEYSPVLTADSHYCEICQIEVNERFFHSIWWGCCVLRPNYIYFLVGHIFAFFTLLIGTNFTLTSVCQPYLFYGDIILLPNNCDDVYYDVYIALGFVTSMYGIGYLLIVTLVLLRQLFIYIPKYSVRYLTSKQHYAPVNREDVQHDVW